MASYQLRTFKDLVDAVREELKAGSTDVTDINRIKRDINITYSELCGQKRWWWLTESITAQIPAYYNQGTCDVYRNSNKVSFSGVIGASKKGYFFSVEGSNEVFYIESHTAGSNEIKISEPWVGATQFGLRYKIWTDKVPLPTNCRETAEVTSGFNHTPLEALGLQEYRRLSSPFPKREGVPEYFLVNDFIEPIKSQALSMPALVSRRSSGIIKTLVFASAVPASLTTNTIIRVSGASQASYNGEYAISQVTTTTVANDTIVYSGKDEYTELASGDTGLVVALAVSETNRSRYRSLTVYPAITKDRITIHIDYIKSIAPLDNDTDEPVIPLDDRIVLLYGALHRAWSRQRNPEEAARNQALYKEKISNMAAYIQDSLDKPLLRPSKIYLGTKRRSFRSRRFNFSLDGFGTALGSPPSGGSTVAVLGLPNSVAIFNADGELEGSSSISTAELNYLDGASSNIQAQISAITATLASAFVTNAQVSPTAAIARSKLASGSASVVLVNDGSGVMSESGVSSTELSFLSGVTPLTTVALANNQVAPAAAISIPVANTFCFVVYSIVRNLINIEGGYMVLLNDGTSADLTIASSDMGATGITLSADISGGNVRVLYTSTNTGFPAQLKYSVIKWSA